MLLSTCWMHALFPPEAHPMLATRSYMTKAVYSAVFPAMAAVYAAQDAQINKNVQNMAEVNVRRHPACVCLFIVVDNRLFSSSSWVGMRAP